MTKERAALFENDDTLDAAEFAPAIKPRPEPSKVGKAAQASGFRSREPQSAPVEATPPPVRRRRTGRNAQMNLKAKPETIEAFGCLADRNGWGLGETLEKAVELLEREYGKI